MIIGNQGRLPAPTRAGAPNVTFRNQDGNAEILLYDSIGAGFFGGIGADDFARELRELGDVESIELRINSDGGDVFEGLAIANQLRRHPARIEASVDGLAASIASVIAMAADSIAIADNAWMMIHNPWGFAAGEADELRRVAETLENIGGTIAKSYQARTTQELATIEEWMAGEEWMDAETSVYRGFADEIDAGEAQLAASIHTGWYQRVPEALAASRPTPPADLAANSPAPSRRPLETILYGQDCVLKARGLRSGTTER